MSKLNISNYKNNILKIKNISGTLLTIGDLGVSLKKGETVNLLHQDPFSKRQFINSDKISNSRDLELAIILEKVEVSNETGILSKEEALTIKNLSSDLGSGGPLFFGAKEFLYKRGTGADRQFDELTSRDVGKLLSFSRNNNNDYDEYKKYRVYEIENPRPFILQIYVNFNWFSSFGNNFRIEIGDFYDLSYYIINVNDFSTFSQTVIDAETFEQKRNLMLSYIQSVVQVREEDTLLEIKVSDSNPSENKMIIDIAIESNDPLYYEGGSIPNGINIDSLPELKYPRGVRDIGGVLTAFNNDFIEIKSYTSVLLKTSTAINKGEVVVPGPNGTVMKGFIQDIFIEVEENMSDSSLTKLYNRINVYNFYNTNKILGIAMNSAPSGGRVRISHVLSSSEKYETSSYGNTYSALDALLNR